jgi:hypothetical protein
MHMKLHLHFDAEGISIDFKHNPHPDPTFSNLQKQSIVNLQLYSQSINSDTSMFEYSKIQNILFKDYETRKFFLVLNY